MNLPALASRSAFSVPYVDSELPCTEPRARNELLIPQRTLAGLGSRGKLHPRKPSRARVAALDDHRVMSVVEDI